LTVQPYTQQQLAAATYGMQANGHQAGQTQELLQGLCLLIQGWAKAGKSSLADTGPRPVLCMDVEQAAKWTPSRKIVWDPLRQTPPAWDGSWDTAVVHVKDFQTLEVTRQILDRGQHPFNSISVDSVPSIQHRIEVARRGYNKMERDDWGVLLKQTTGIVWGFKDLLTHPTNRVWAVTYVCPTHWDYKRNKWRPYLHGQSGDVVPFVPDIEGWVYAADDGTHRMWTGPSKDYETGDRLWGRLPYDMQLGYPGMVQGWTVESMVQHVLATR